MEWTAKGLIEHLQTLDPNEEIIGTIWNKEDVAYTLQEIQSNVEDGEWAGRLPTLDQIAKADPEALWKELSGGICHAMDNSTSEIQDDLYWGLVTELIREADNG
jgi:hypothetical protein